MSADNGVYIKKYRDGYRVAGFTNAEDLDAYPVGSKPWEVMQAYFFRDARHWATEKEALDCAKRLAEKFTVLEYGICELDPVDLPFPRLSDDYVDGYLAGHFDGWNAGREVFPPSDEPCL